jgi:hypothetical protein
MVQVVLDSVDMNDVTGITGNLAKFSLGLATIFFDVRVCFLVQLDGLPWKTVRFLHHRSLIFALFRQAVFFTQHYVLYPSPIATGRRGRRPSDKDDDDAEEEERGGTSSYGKNHPCYRHKPSNRFEVVCLLEPDGDDVNTYGTVDDDLDDDLDDDDEEEAG